MGRFPRQREASGHRETKGETIIQRTACGRWSTHLIRPGSKLGVYEVVGLWLAAGQQSATAIPLRRSALKLRAVAGGVATDAAISRVADITSGRQASPSVS